MKTIILFLALVTALFAEENAPKAVFVVESGNTFKASSYETQNLVLSAGNGHITINLKTGQVDLPKDMTLPDAAVAFWLRVAQAFPECRQAMLTGDPTPLTTKWGADLAKEAGTYKEGTHYEMIGVRYGGNKVYEFGLRSDGVVVWREVKP